MMLLPSADERDQAYARFPVLGSRRHIPAGNLSGGEQQMLTMAPVMVKPPSLLIADEPTLGLAPLIVEQIMGVFAELRDEGVTLFVVEERAKAVLDIADDVALLELGRLVWDGPRAGSRPGPSHRYLSGPEHRGGCPYAGLGAAAGGSLRRGRHP